jgi:ankyrin repeat protein
LVTYDGKLEVARYLIEEGKVDVDCKEGGLPPICNAARLSCIDVIEYFLSVGANVNARQRSSGWNALHSAAYYA